MEGGLSQGGMVSGAPQSSFSGLGLQGSSIRVHHHQPQEQQPSNAMHHHHSSLRRQGSLIHQSMYDGNFPLTMGINTHNSDHQTMPVTDYNKNERGKNNSMSDEDEPSYTEDGVDGQTDASRGKRASPWQRVKWTDKMVRLLITAVSYIGDDVSSDCGMRRKFTVLQKKGKWKSVSKVMAERGFHVSPQQCEDKFNDLNKRYKKLNDIIGRGTSCQVVENPALLDVLDYLSEKEKDDVRKILSSKHLFYEEMCSYHNGNRLHLPHDPALQRSLQLALRSRDDYDNEDPKRHHNDDLDEDDQEAEVDEHDEFEENHTKRFRQGPGREDMPLGNMSLQQMSHVDMNQISTEGTGSIWSQKQSLDSRMIQMEEQKLQIQLETLELEKQRFKWERFSKKRDQELEKMRMENERMKLENERMALELKRKEIS